MYIPESFREHDLTRLHEFIEQNSFGILVSQPGESPFASHLPFLLERNRGTQGVLIGHMARANPQGQLAEGTSVLAIFSGPHAYISPGWYEEQNVVPTWNYVAVHVTGTLRLMTHPEDLENLLRQTVHLYESFLPFPWSMESPEPEFLQRLMQAIVGFSIEIQGVEGKWKLSQNHSPERRANVVRRLRNAGGANREQIAELMSQTLGETNS